MSQLKVGIIGAGGIARGRHLPCFQRNKKVARALVKLLQEANVDFAILGNEERCTGEPARRLGHEYLFQTLAQGNVETLKQYRFQTIVTACPQPVPPSAVIR